MVVGRFQVMATLQAARAFVLGLPQDLSLSWGLNRAIFYAAAKRGFKRKRMPRRSRAAVLEKPVFEEKDAFFLGDEMAYKTDAEGETCFIIGDKPQTVEDFRRQIESRFAGRFDDAWREAIELVKSFDRETLLSQRRFYESVYRPRRDELSKKWSKISA